MKEIMRLYWEYRTGGATREEAIEWALTRVGISSENAEWACQQVTKELSRRQELSMARRTANAG